MNDILGTLKGKLGPLPVYVWAGLGTIALALYLMRKKSKANQTSAAADQTNSQLGSAAQLANMFTVAGLMPYQGGNVYINTTDESPDHHPGNPPPPPKPAPKPQATYKITAADVKNNKGNSLGILNGIAKKYGVNPAVLWAYNLAPGVRSPQTAAHLKAERAKGGSWLTAGESIVVPPKNWKP